MKIRKEVSKKINKPKTSQELDKMALYFLLMCSELIERDFRKNLPKIIEKVRKKYPKGWSPK